MTGVFEDVFCGYKAPIFLAELLDNVDYSGVELSFEQR